jgi:hypothetical protein
VNRVHATIERPIHSHAHLLCHVCHLCTAFLLIVVVLPDEVRQKEQANTKDYRMKKRSDQKDQQVDKVDQAFHFVIPGRSAEVSRPIRGGIHTLTY